jgi:integrase
MPRELLKAAEVPKLIAFNRGKGKFRDGAGLYLDVRAPGQASWAYQFRLAGKTRWGSIGPASIYSLADARDKHRDLRRLVHEGKDPRADAAEAAGATFEEALIDYLAEASPEWKGGADGKEAISYQRSFDQIPAFLRREVESIEPKDINVVVKVWADKPVTMRRMQTRIKTVLKFARTGERRNRKPGRDVVHHAAMDIADVPQFMRELSALGTVESRALMWTILTAARTEETLGATSPEIVEVAAAKGEPSLPTWVIPGERMKAERQHRVPLTPEMLALIDPRGEPDAYLFPGDGVRSSGAKLWHEGMRRTLGKLRPGAGLTVHGFRSTFRDWVGTKTNYGRDLAEWSLAHAVGTKLERDYARADLLAKRRPLMADWAAFCMSLCGNVVAA